MKAAALSATIRRGFPNSLNTGSNVLMEHSNVFLGIGCRRHSLEKPSTITSICELAWTCGLAWSMCHVSNISFGFALRRLAGHFCNSNVIGSIVFVLSQQCL